MIIRSYFCKNFISFYFCFNIFICGINRGDQFLPNFTYENVEKFVEKEDIFNEAKTILKNFLHCNNLTTYNDIICKETTHIQKPCINCFMTIDKNTYGIRFYKNGKIEVGLFASKVEFHKLKKGYYIKPKAEKWEDVEKNTIVEKIKQTPKNIVRGGKSVISSVKTTYNVVKTMNQIARVIVEKQPEIKKIKENFNIVGNNISTFVEKSIDNMYYLSANEYMKNFTKEGIEKTIEITDKMNSLINLCCCC